MKTAEQSSRRGKEIAAILLRHHAERGMTPEKLRMILEDLGPTFIKLGQILSMRTDILPVNYCKELELLRAQVAPMPFAQVKNAVEEALGHELGASFTSFEEQPIGSASIAQAHLATLPQGQRVVVKVQRPHIRETMGEDIQLLRKATGVMRLTGLDKTVDLAMVLDEMWEVTQQEMDFRREADHLREFAEKNAGIRCIACPRVYGELCCETLLTMEYVDGFSLRDKDKLLAAGYDMRDIGDKLAENYVKQIVDDGFFHADPHPGNIRIREGQIVWIDMGMMGRLSQRDRKLFREAVKAVSAHDVEALRRIVMALGKITGSVDGQKLTADIDDFLSRYESMELGGLDLGVFLKELMDLAQEHHVAMPSGMTMLARGAVTVEGVLREISPETSILAIVTNHYANQMLEQVDLKKESLRFVSDLHGSLTKAARLPSQLSDLLRTANKGQARLSVEVHTRESLGISDKTAGRLIRGLLSGTALLGGCVLCLAKGLPTWGALPVPAWIAFGVATVLGASACIVRKER